MEALKKMDHRGWRTQTVDITFPKSEGPAGLENALVRICGEVTQALADGYKMLVLSDRGERTPVCLVYVVLYVVRVPFWMLVRGQRGKRLKPVFLPLSLSLLDSELCPLSSRASWTFSSHLPRLR